MKQILKLSILIILATACRKENNTRQKSITDSTSCLRATVLTTNFPAVFFQSVFFIDEQNGFIGGANGEIYKTTNAGQTWTALNSTTTLPVYDIYFIDKLKGFAVGGENSCGGSGCVPGGGFILRTLNGGQTWTKVYTPSDKIEISSVYFVNSTTGFCAGDNVIFKTANGGQTWTEYKINDPGGKMMKISFADAQHGFIVCLFDKILKTNNAGSTWDITSPNTNTGYYSLSPSGGVVYVSGQGKIIKSIDGGSSWSELVNSPDDVFALHFIDKNIGFAFGRGNYSGGDYGYSYGSIYCTNDGGATWSGTADIKEVGLIHAVSFPTNKTGYAVSGNKVIRISTN